jgi:hypothetical protein
MPKLLVPVQRSLKKAPSHSAAIILTGRRLDDHFIVACHGTSTSLTLEALRALIKLILACPNEDSGTASVPRNTIYRLRKAINQALGRGVAERLIETGFGQECLLAIPPKELKSQVLVTPRFLGMVRLKVLSQADADRLRELCGPCSNEDADALLSGDKV